MEMIVNVEKCEWDRVYDTASKIDRHGARQSLSL